MGRETTVLSVCFEFTLRRCSDVLQDCYCWRWRLDEVKLLEKAVNKAMRDGGDISRVEPNSVPTRRLRHAAGWGRHMFVNSLLVETTPWPLLRFSKETSIPSNLFRDRKPSNRWVSHVYVASLSTMYLHEEHGNNFHAASLRCTTWVCLELWHGELCGTLQILQATSHLSGWVTGWETSQETTAFANDSVGGSASCDSEPSPWPNPMPKLLGMVVMLLAWLACDTEGLLCSPAERQMSFLKTIEDCGPELQESLFSYQSCFP